MEAPGGEIIPVEPSKNKREQPPSPSILKSTILLEAVQTDLQAKLHTHMQGL